MKLLSIAISSYNAAAYLHYCVESLVIGGEQVGILIINDGSQDQTQEIAECLASKYPNIVRAIYQENKCHGGAVNRGLAEASGRYFKPQLFTPNLKTIQNPCLSLDPGWFLFSPNGCFLLDK
ncbi:glycosyltransferase family A protein, partial [Streptococcus pneumoniae]|nr:glycosyltransferase family A protein [Streptococcus pneumoniae]MDS2328733.1 glycosyltransferase family A protein [Streptococcus pneumoniae]MDS2457497.1 glycosyltransferase family A protein [Streptococcus pneumoniae]MDS2464782.1 glycosyltransferase family A protein [Streptococcus pneumoniae]MDS2509922.1 glycosyltransferase family A protein [Streptococcus pneumoniae]